MSTERHPGPPPHPYGGSGGTADRLTAALHARTATLGEDTLTTRAPGFPAAGPPSSGYAPREPLLPRWGWIVAAIAVIASIVAGAVLGVRGGSASDGPAALPPPQTKVVDTGVTAQATITSLTVRGQTIRLEVDLKNLSSDKTWYVSTALGRGLGDSDLSGTTLTLDGLLLRPAEDASGACMCSDSGSIEEQSTRSFYVVFDVPKSLPKTADVSLKGFPSWLNVPISR